MPYTMGHLRTSFTEQTMDQEITSLARQLTQDVINSEVIEANRPEQVVVRDLLPQEDLESGGDNGYTTGGDAEWRQDWAAGSATADEFNESYEIDSEANAQSKIILLYGLQFPGGDVVTRQFRALSGTGGTQGVKAWVETEPLENDDEGTGLFSQPVRYGATEDGSLQQWIEDALDGQRFRILGLVGEKVTKTITVPQNPQVAQG